MHCVPQYWPCANDLQCIPAKAVCDGYFDCHDESDEYNQICACHENEWPCQDGRACIGESYVCDSFNDCEDHSDEHEDICEHWNCTQNKWKCRVYPQCIFATDICDGQIHCLDGTDEKACDNFACPMGEQKCANGLQCISEEAICDDNIDCQDGSDELCRHTCLKNPPTKPTIVRKCAEDHMVCVPVGQYCDAVSDCPYASDEQDCSCEDWNMVSCQIETKQVCLRQDWVSEAFSTTAPCQRDAWSVTRTMSSATIDEFKVSEDYGKLHQAIEPLSPFVPVDLESLASYWPLTGVCT